MKSPTRAPSLLDLAAPHMSEGAEWIIRDDEIELGRCIGSGSFGDVYRAQWKHTDVAVKRLNNVTEAIVAVSRCTELDTAGTAACLHLPR